MGENVTGTEIVWPVPSVAGSDREGVPSVNWSDDDPRLESVRSRSARERQRHLIARADRRPREREPGSTERLSHRGAEPEHLPVARADVQASRADAGDAVVGRGPDRGAVAQDRLAVDWDRVIGPQLAACPRTVGAPDRPHERAAGRRPVGRDHGRAAAPAEHVGRACDQRQRRRPGARQAVLVDVEQPAAVLAAGRRDVDVAAVARPHPRPPPHPAARAGALDHVVRPVGALVVAPEVVAVQQVHVALLADDHPEMRDRRGAEVRVGEPHERPRAEVPVKDVQLPRVERREEVDRRERAARIDVQTHDRLAERSRRRRPGRGRAGRSAVAGAQQDRPCPVGGEPDPRLPDPGAVASGRVVDPACGDLARRRDAEHPSLIGPVVAVAAKPGVDHAVHQQQAWPLLLVGGQERHCGIVVCGAAQPDGEPGPL